ncbi:endocuticle structural protein SgAbd-6-like [Neodiprion lecontei]|uniref:Endocuticle structural protein SgAbd-6-like n=1 Tax=Neodiprion lecontei TaxID=441921 RepID=A0A6J0BUV8_NEOLC|nr:endocuticle structural protein SgAbd-6-like [Neodiprion lecontei]
MNTVLFTLFAIMAVTVAEVVDPTATPIAILSQSQSMESDGSFKSEFKTANGISERVEGIVRKIADGSDVTVVRGSVTWVDKDGKTKTFTYVADENGYRPEADFFPTTPPVPLAIARAIEWAKTHPESTTIESEE